MAGILPELAPDARRAAPPAAVEASLIGRDSDLRRLRESLTGFRLVTVLGPGGVGKTSLVLGAVRTAEAVPAGDVIVCELADVLIPDSVRPAVASQLGVLLHPGAPIGRSLPSDTELLVVLDNCEHVVDAAADAAAELLSAGPHVRVVATSREPLRVPGECVLPLNPLPVPASVVDPDAAASPAVELFRRRAAAAGADLPDDAATLAQITRICRALDGLPLALEIAAARARSMGLRDIADRMDAPLSLLRAGTRGPERHRSLRSLFDWSWELLTPEERSLVSVLAVYPSGADLEAATAAGWAAGLEPDQIVDLLDGLVAKSLLTARTSSGRSRYMLPQTLRAYGVERLAADDALTRVRNTHADHYVELARRTRSNALLSWTPETFTDLALEFGNFRAAVTWTLAEDADPDRTFTLLAPLWFLCQLQGEEEIAALAGRALHRWPRADHPLWSEVAAAASSALIGLDQMPEGRERAHQAIESNTSPVGVAYAWRTLAEDCIYVEDSPETALERLDRSAAAAREAGYTPFLCLLDLTRAEVLAQAGRTAEALGLVKVAIRHARRAGNRTLEAWGSHLLGQLLCREDPAAAQRWLEAGLTTANSLPYPHCAGSIVRGMGSLTALGGDVAGAACLFGDAMDRFTKMGCVIERWTTVAAVLPVLVDSGRRELASALLRELDASAVALRRLHAPAVDRVREVLRVDSSGPPVLEGLSPTGLDALFALTRDEMRNIAAGAGRTEAVPPRPPAAPGEASLRRVGHLWELTWAGTCVPVPELKGLIDLAVLLERPGTDVPALELAAGAGVRGRRVAPEEDTGRPGDLGEQIDASARAAYAARIRELRAELDEADAAGDAERGAKVQKELDFLTRELSSAYGLHGPRRSGDPAEKARAAVTGRIRAALAKIREAHPGLGRHLDRSVVTGRFCAYRPEEPVTWTVAR